MKRRDFLKYGAAGLTAICVGDCAPWLLESEAEAQRRVTRGIRLRITDGIKDMATSNSINAAQCYFWLYKADEPDLPAEVPGPIIFATAGEQIQLTLSNELDQPHAFFIPGISRSPGLPARPIFSSGPILPGAPPRTFRMRAPLTPGTYMYFDNLNAPVNRVMGLHGALVVMPRVRRTGRNRMTPYARPTRTVQQLFNDLGSTAWFPGFAWDEGDPGAGSFSPAFRQYIWLLHQASPNLFAEVGDFKGEFNAGEFVRRFLRDEFSPTNNNGVPQYFTINGQSGHFAHNNPYTNPNNRAGEPVLIRVLNAGLWTHSLHMHANHFYVTAINGLVQSNVIWLDTFDIHPMDMVDWLVPYHRPPDIPNLRGIGRSDPGLTTTRGGQTWPPIEEINSRIPAAGLSVQLSPLSYPMHDHSEPSQTSQGGNYNMGLIAGLNFTGERIGLGSVVNFPHQPIKLPPGGDPVSPPTGTHPPTSPPPWFDRS
ncbi:MAG: multicopper oxidase domain-containing protein [Syntrophobacteraceae bacterium]|jgi:FtsP/CotA-like multicopper oxidase with cupredoxin domain|nr:multicopper oxidase domain-containing protein [Syntrophobacteraceae bacterium]